MVGQSTVCGSYLRGHREFPNHTRLFGNGRLESGLYFAANDVFAKGTDEVLDAARNPDAERMKFGKFYGVANGVTPQAGIGVQDECVVHAQLHFGQGEARWIGVKVPVGRNEFEVHTVVHQQQQALFVVPILVGNKTFRRRIGIDAGDGPAKKLLKARSVGLKGHPAGNV